MLSEENLSHANRLVCSHSHSSISSRSTYSSRSAVSLVAIEARAKADAARTRAAYAQREIEIKVKKAQLQVEETRLEATLEAPQQEKAAGAALAEAIAFEAIVDADNIEESSEHECKQISSNLYSDTYIREDHHVSNKTVTPLFQSDDREQQNALPSQRESIQYS